jgi:hypothetical protein
VLASEVEFLREVSRLCVFLYVCDKWSGKPCVPVRIA